MQEHCASHWGCPHISLVKILPSTPLLLANNPHELVTGSLMGPQLQHVHAESWALFWASCSFKGLFHAEVALAAQMYKPEMLFFPAASNPSSNLIQFNLQNFYCSPPALPPPQSQPPASLSWTITVASWRLSCIHSVATQRDIITTHPTLKTLQIFPLHWAKTK